MRLTPWPRALICALGLFLALSGAVHAQNDWPNKPVRIIASFAPGGSSDLVARQLAQHLSTRYGQQFIVENRAGAGGNNWADTLSVAHPGNGTIGHVAAEQLRIGNGANLRSIPYRGRPLARPAATRVHATHGARRQRVAGAHPRGPRSRLVSRQPGTGRRIDLDRGTVEEPRRADHRRTQHQRPGQPHQRQGDASAVAARVVAGVAVDLALAGVATWMSSGAAAGCG